MRVVFDKEDLAVWEKKDRNERRAFMNKLLDLTDLLSKGPVGLSVEDGIICDDDALSTIPNKD